MEITLPSGRKIGDGHEPFIICEVGSNWSNLEDCLHSIRQAKNCGADAAKFQAYNHSALYGFKHVSGMTEYDHLEKDFPGTLPLEWLPNLKQESERVGIEFMCTAFSPELYDAVDPFVNIHKIASAECTHKRILEKVRALGKPVILSTGAHGVEDIHAALSVLGDLPKVLMYCVAAYPAIEVNLALLSILRDVSHSLVGFSDHTLDASVVPTVAISSGACVLEKHVTFIEGETPDSPHSLDGGQFSRMVQRIRGHAIDSLGPTREEKSMVLRSNRRLTANGDIAVNTVYTAGDNFDANRSLKDDTHAFHPFMIDEVNGKVAKRAIKAGDGIGPGDI